MKTSLSALLLYAAAVVVFVSAAEARKYPMTAASIVPSATGQIDTGKDQNGNTKVDLKVEHLANPANLSPAQTTYIVWFQERGGEPQNKGLLTVGKDLKGEFETVTPSKNFDVFVTGETDPMVRTPTGPEVLRATVQE